MKVVLFKGKGLVSWLIRWQTRSEYSHAALLLNNGTLIESMEGVGVRVREFNTEKDTEVFEVEGLTPMGVELACEFLNDQIGKKYDWWMVLRFVSRRQETRSTTGKWFCSELVFAAMQKAGVELLRDTEPWEVSPGLLGRSPRLKKG